MEEYNNDHEHEPEQDLEEDNNDHGHESKQEMEHTDIDGQSNINEV